MRQLGLRLILSHQSFSQLKRGDYDLTTMIFQAQSRMIFGLQGEDADLLAHELASINFDPKRIKEENYVRRQRIAGHRIVELASWSESEGEAENWNDTYGKNWSRPRRACHTACSATPTAKGTRPRAARASGKAAAGAAVPHAGASQQLVPIHEEYDELANRTFYSFQEQRSIWASKSPEAEDRAVRPPLVDDETLYDVDVKQSKAGLPGVGWNAIHRDLPEVIDDRQRA